MFAATGSPWSAAGLLARYAWQKRSLLGSAVSVRLRRRSIRASASAGISTGAHPRILVHTMGAGVGDDIVIARLLRDLNAACGPFEFEIACNNEGRSRWVFEAVPGFAGCRSAFAFDGLADLYALSLRITHAVLIEHAGDLSATRLAAVRARLADFASRNAGLLSGLPYTFGDLGRRAVFANATRATYLHAQAGIAYGGSELPIARDERALARHGLAAGGYITLHNGFDPAFIVSGPYSTKSYRRFGEVVARLKAAQPGLRIVQVGTPDTSTPIPGVDLDLLGKTSLPEVAAIIAAARLHVDIDSGLAHLAATLATPAVILFGPSDADYFGYPESINLRPGFCGGCWWIDEAWMDQCPRHFSEARCMSSHDPAEVAQRIAAAIASTAASRGAPAAVADAAVAASQGRHAVGD